MQRQKATFKVTRFTQVSTEIPQTQQEATTDQILSCFSKMQKSQR